MYKSTSRKGLTLTIVSAFTVLAMVAATTPVVLAQSSYKIEQVVSDGDKSKETDAVLKFTETSFEITPDKQKFKSASRTFAFTDVKIADYSYTKKPMLSGGGAVATALLVGFIFALPFLFIKKKNHWLSVRTEKDFVVLKLDRTNYRQIVAEFETHGIKVNTVEEEKKK